VAPLRVCEQATRRRHHIEGGTAGGGAGAAVLAQLQLNDPKTADASMWLWTERCSTQMLNYSPYLRRYHHAACSRRITCNTRRMTRAMQHLTRSVVSATKRKSPNFSTRRRRRRQTRYNRIGAECAECTRACDEYFGRNGRVVDSSTGTSGRTERMHLGLRLHEWLGLQRHSRLTTERTRSQTRSASRATCP
jgi:hypothetical protein